jgi:iron complex outermembrane receptor protein
VFFHANFAITPRLKWDVGARYTYEKLKMRSMDWTSTRTPAGFKHYISDDTVDLLVQGTRSWDAVTPMTGLTYEFDGAGALDSGIVYATVSTGFLSGGINNEIDLEVFGDFAVFDPEHVTAYELGLKTNWTRGRANLALFYTDYKDKQEVIDIDNSAGVFPGDPAISVFDNAAKLEIYGFEVETTFNPVDNLHIDLNLAYLHNSYKDFPTFDFLTGTVIDQSDIVVADFSPPWSGNASVSYNFGMSGGSSLTPRVGVYYQDAYRTNETSNVNVRPGGLCYQGGYPKVDARLTWETSEGDMQIALWGTNLTNEDVFRACAVSSGNGYQTYSLEPPARYGIQLTKRW